MCNCPLFNPASYAWPPKASLEGSWDSNIPLQSLCVTLHYGPKPKTLSKSRDINQLPVLRLSGRRSYYKNVPYKTCRLEAGLKREAFACGTTCWILQVSWSTYCCKCYKIVSSTTSLWWNILLYVKLLYSSYLCRDPLQVHHIRGAHATAKHLAISSKRPRKVASRLIGAWSPAQISISVYIYIMLSYTHIYIICYPPLQNPRFDCLYTTTCY